jgi:hypothetical protein
MAYVDVRVDIHFLAHTTNPSTDRQVLSAMDPIDYCLRERRSWQRKLFTKIGNKVTAQRHESCTCRGYFDKTITIPFTILDIVY